MTIIWIIIFILPPAGVSAVTTVTGHRGHSAQIRCPYESGYETYIKYLCRGTCSTLPWGTKDIPVQSGSTAKDQRFSLDDDTAARVFTITITDLRPEDGGTYWCGIQRSYPFPDIYTEVLLLVTLDLPLTASHSTSSSVQTQSTHSPPFPPAGLCSFSQSQFDHPSKHSHQLMYYSFCTVYYAIMIINSAMLDWDYKKDAPKNQPSKVMSPVYKNPTTTTSQSDSVYQFLNADINQLDAVYQTLNPCSNQSDSVYQSLMLNPTNQIQSNRL
ncbi:hypothetical protein NFI96_023555 [Prochilodus magdalenae]|nr:hypothetical protein NFI96_023555 [Prochilodus magdalenae]